MAWLGWALISLGILLLWVAQELTDHIMEWRERWWFWRNRHRHTYGDIDAEYAVMLRRFDRDTDR